MIKYICKKCGAEYYRKPSVKKTSYCSRQCLYSSGHSDETIKKIKAKRATQVLKFRPIIRSGYFYIKSWGHPACGKQGYVAIHRLVMEKHLGRYLSKREVIHHINHDITDNRIENLELFASHGLHTKIAHPEIRERQRVNFKGKRHSPRTEFKKGMIPWNKKV